VIYAKDHKTTNMFDPFSRLGPKLLTDSWPGLFRKEAFPNLPVHLLSRHYERAMGRQMKDLSDDETYGSSPSTSSGTMVLGITGDSDAAAYLCPKNLWNIRDLISRHALEGSIFGAITDHD